MFLSVFDVFKIGIGPSSSHTMGPMTAANRFLERIAGRDVSQAAVRSLRVSLHGSLAYTGEGHGTGRAVILGLNGERPDQVNLDVVDMALEQIREARQVTPPGHPAYAFDPSCDLIYDRKTLLTGHANGMLFTALDADGAPLFSEIYYSIGGGFVVTEAELVKMREATDLRHDEDVPYPFSNARDMLRMAAQSGLSIAAMKRANEESR